MSSIVHNDGTVILDGDLPFTLSAYDAQPGGALVDANQVEVMGEYLHQRYASRELAQIAATEAQSDAREFYPAVVVEVVAS